ncbi:MAG: ABC transporter ATP-binding protein [Lachnospiraceae bacterium]|nr:ABC transporter ATP-binding protein [Lachnospiraceae bacterium]
MLKIEGLKKNYPGFSLDVTMQVRPGMITGLIGENGAGKSTIFKAVTGLIRPDGGRITLLGKDLAGMTGNDRRKIGTVFSESGFSGYLTVRDVRRILKDMFPDFDESGFVRKCGAFRLDEAKKIRDLSTGLKARLKVLTALSHHADLLLLDEPTAGLDVLARDELYTMIREYMAEDEKRAVLISSHISTDLERLCDDFYMIDEGKILLHEESDRLMSDYAVLKVSEEDYGNLDKAYLIRKQKEPFGYSVLTDQARFYTENYPGITIEKAGLDELIMMMIRGEKL